MILFSTNDPLAMAAVAAIHAGDVTALQKLLAEQGAKGN